MLFEDGEELIKAYHNAKDAGVEKRNSRGMKELVMQRGGEGKRVGSQFRDPFHTACLFYVNGTCPQTYWDSILEYPCQYVKIVAIRIIYIYICIMYTLYM